MGLKDKHGETFLQVCTVIQIPATPEEDKQISEKEISQKNKLLPSKPS